MNFLSWGPYVKYICKEEYPGAVFFDFFIKFSMVLLFITIVSVFLHCFFNKYKGKKIFKRVSFSSLWCILITFVYHIYYLFLGLFSVKDYDGSWISNVQIACFTQGSYLLNFIVSYVFCSILTYLNIRIWYNFIDKNKRYLKWINIIFVLLVIIIFIVLFNTEGTLDILNKVVKVD